MLKIASSLISAPILLGAGALASANKRLIIPTALGAANLITTGTGMLTPEEAKIQEDLFLEYLKPISDVLDTIE